MNRRDRRGVNAKPQKRDASAPADLHVELQKLARAHNALAKAFNTNTEAFLQSMTAADVMIWVLRVALNDMVNGRIRITEEGGDKQVDLVEYLRLYKEHVDAEAAKSKEPIITNGQSDPPIVFGGDS